MHDRFCAQEKGQSRFPVGSGVPEEPLAILPRDPVSVVLSLTARLALIRMVRERRVSFHAAEEKIPPADQRRCLRQSQRRAVSSPSYLQPAACLTKIVIDGMFMI
jgi:hypothetical protein